MARVISTLLALIAVIMAGTASAAPAVLYQEDASDDATPQERRLRAQTISEIENAFTIINDPVRQVRVERIVRRIVPYLKRSLDYQVTIISDDKMINAFAIAGGPIYVATGMLDFARTDLELAGVIAHELAHADKGHVIEQVARNEKMTLLAIAAMIASQGSAAGMVAASALQVAVMGEYSIDLEKEADAVGIDVLDQAGFDPVGMLTLQEHFAHEEMKRPQIELGIYQTHPKTKQRIESAERYMRDRGLPVRRKLALGILRTRIERENGRASLFIDDTELLSTGESYIDTLEKLKNAFDERLQLETAPFDISVNDEEGGRALFIRGQRIVGTRELGETITADELRDRVQRALNAARDKHPLADYFR